MKLKQFTINEFQSFNDSGEINLKNSMNLIIGQNNSGKSSILRSLDADLLPDSHVHKEGSKKNPFVRLKIKITGEEFFDCVSAEKNPMSIKRPNHNPGIKSGARSFFGKGDEWEFDVINIPEKGFCQKEEYYNYFSGERDSSPRYISIEFKDGEMKFSEKNIQASEEDDIPKIINRIWRKKFFHFVAERLNINQCHLERTENLYQDARNLPALIHTLHGERGSVLQKIIRQLREILPSVGNISVALSSGRNDMVEIRVWPTENMDGPGRSFSLSQSGAGISQVLAILCCVATSENSVIAIDEIDTFLHPCAVKALLRVMQTEYSSHQYIITTHSPEVISFSNPETVFLVRREEYSSSVTSVDIKNIDELRSASDHLGVSMNDVFAAKRIIWVEGQTEELCFPWIYENVCKKQLSIGTFFTAVVATGNFLEKRKDKKLVYEIYERLTKAVSLYVNNPVFSFDQEGLSQQNQRDMIRQSGGMIQFLPRRMLECYTLDPSAIRDLIKSKDEGKSDTLTASAVEEAMMSIARNDTKLIVKDAEIDISNNAWLEKIDAANLIDKTIGQLTEGRLDFRKTKDTLYLIMRINKLSPCKLEALGIYISSLVNKSET